MKQKNKLEKRGKYDFLSISGIMVVLIGWEIVAHFLKMHSEFSATIFPTWEDIFGKSLPGFSSFWGGSGMGEISAEPSYIIALLVLGKHSLITILRVLGGAVIGIILGVGVGMLMGWSPIFGKLTDPIVELIRQIPLLALIPLFLLWFGGREIGNILYIIFGIFTIIVVTTRNAIRNVPPIYQNLTLTLGGNRAQVYKYVIAPAILPELLGGIKVSLGLAWAITLGAEYLAAQVGLGRLMILSEIFLFTGRMIIITLLFMLFSWFFNYVAVKVIKRANKWVDVLS